MYYLTGFALLFDGGLLVVSGVSYVRSTCWKLDLVFSAPWLYTTSAFVVLLYFPTPTSNALSLASIPPGDVSVFSGTSEGS